MPTLKEISITLPVGVSAAGNLDVQINHACALSRALPGAVTFIKDASSIAIIETLRMAEGPFALVCSETTAAELQGNPDIGFILTADPRMTFIKLVAEHFAPPTPLSGIHPTAVVSRDAHIDSQASVGPGCVIGAGCVVGKGSVLHANVVLYANVNIGRNVTVHGGTVIGGDGFGYERDDDGTMIKFPHLGGVLIENDVEIGSNTSIDRGSLADTIIRRGAKIDNQVHISHNCDIGEDAVVIAQSMVGGSVRIGSRAWLAPAAVILNQIVIGEDSLVGLGAVVVKNVEAKSTVMGSPAMPEPQFKALRRKMQSL